MASVTAAHTGVQLQQFGKLNHCNWDFDQNENRSLQEKRAGDSPRFHHSSNSKAPSNQHDLRHAQQAIMQDVYRWSSVLKDGAATPTSQR
mmetsp:Transcript_725/g.1989  ORF Transcript_725/g.1989 Transcript_725/m.1989 type:complete len:90 (+) Transcript_725:235-504(+)